MFVECVQSANIREGKRMAESEKKETEGELRGETPLTAADHTDRREEWLGQLAEDPKLLNK